MKITVFGASGRIGGHVVQQALDAGHAVTAVVRDPAAVATRHPALSVMAVPGLTEPDPLVPAVDGSDAAISAVGPRRLRDVAVASNTTRGILGALAATGVRRFVAVSAVPVGPIPADAGLLQRRVLVPLISALLREPYADLTLMEREIQQSGTEWTIVRPPRLTDRGLTGVYRTAVESVPPHFTAIGRAEVAHFMLAVLDDPSTVGHAIGIAR
jgi:putative NADH-flavin reductase